MTQDTPAHNTTISIYYTYGLVTSNCRFPLPLCIFVLEYSQQNTVLQLISFQIDLVLCQCFFTECDNYVIEWRICASTNYAIVDSDNGWSPALIKSIIWCCMMTSSNWNIFGVTGPLCGKFTGHRWIPLTKAIGAEPWCFLCSEQTVK